MFILGSSFYLINSFSVLFCSSLLLCTSSFIPFPFMFQHLLIHYSLIYSYFFPWCLSCMCFLFYLLSFVPYGVLFSFFSYVYFFKLIYPPYAGFPNSWRQSLHTNISFIPVAWTRPSALFHNSHSMHSFHNPFCYLPFSVYLNPGLC